MNDLTQYRGSLTKTPYSSSILGMSQGGKEGEEEREEEGGNEPYKYISPCHMPAVHPADPPATEMQ